MQSWSKISRHLKEIDRDGDPNQKLAGGLQKSRNGTDPHTLVATIMLLVYEYSLR